MASYFPFPAFPASWILASSVGVGILIGALLVAAIIGRPKQLRKIPAVSKQIPEALGSCDACEPPRNRLLIQGRGFYRWYRLGNLILHGYTDESGLMLWDESPGREGQTGFLLDADCVDCRIWHATVNWHTDVADSGEVVGSITRERPSPYTAADLVIVDRPKWANDRFKALSPIASLE